ncbi:glycosyltransferase family 2 protein [Paenibacillus contaminans]|uniref:Glycosyltransferase family 2 protein n=1 Tax=Paenibacillus contaminans TaxID=450362 RepID=A0A329MIQ7_9BACL|nr:glycosyltransferase family 2 protein [Paenibacillus contaminans]RAV19851.1 glycosyltransferase family 2 protein [Paenibacillus contaminans]
MRTLVIIPAYNEQNSIEQVIYGVKTAHPHIDIVVVNDGSTDSTAEHAKRTGLATVIELPINLGIGGAMQTGYRYAYRNGYDIAVQIDGDGQHDPGELNEIVQEVMAGRCDCCIGSRFLRKTAYKSSLSRRFGIFFFSWMVQWMTGIRVTDPTSGFRAVNRTVIGIFAEEYPDDYPEVEAVVMLARRRLAIAEMSVLMHRRTAGRSSITPWKSLYYMLKVSLAVIMTRLRGSGDLR